MFSICTPHENTWKPSFHWSDCNPWEKWSSIWKANAWIQENYFFWSIWIDSEGKIEGVRVAAIGIGGTSLRSSKSKSRSKFSDFIIFWIFWLIFGTIHNPYLSKDHMKEILGSIHINFSSCVEFKFCGPAI